MSPHTLFFPFLFFFLPPQGGECLKPTVSKKAGERNHPGYPRVNAPDCAMNCFIPSTRKKKMGVVIFLSSFWYGLAQLLFKQTCRQLERKWPCIFLILPQAMYLLNLLKVIAALQLLMVPCCFYNFKNVLFCPQPLIAATIQFMIFSSPRILTSLKGFIIFSSTSKIIIF